MGSKVLILHPEARPLDFYLQSETVERRLLAIPGP